MSDNTAVKDRFSEFLRELETLESTDEGQEALRSNMPVEGSNYW